LPQAAWLPAEDAVDLDRPHRSFVHAKSSRCRFARIANFDDLDPLGMEPGSSGLSSAGEPIPADAEIVILPGSKSTIGDLASYERRAGTSTSRRMYAVAAMCLGLCGGYQMLGRTIADSRWRRWPRWHGRRPGTARHHDDHERRQIDHARSAAYIAQTGAAIEGYEIHLGRSKGADCARPLLDIEGRADGASSADGRVQGTYVHGLFTGDAFRKAWLAHFGITSSLAYEAA